MNIPTSFQSIGDLFTGSGTGAIDIGIILKGGNIDLTKIDWGVVDWTSFKDMADYSNLDWGELDLSGLQTLKDILWAQIDSNLLNGHCFQISKLS